MLEELRRLLDHMAWADERVARSVEAGGSDLARERYAHVIGAEQIWLARIRGEPDGPVWPSFEGEGTERDRRDVLDGYRELISGLGSDDLNRIIVYENSAGRAFESRLSDIILHVFLHGTYHRGQIAMLLRDGGDEPAPSDYIAFVRGAAAATRGDAENRPSPGDRSSPGG